MTLVRILKGTLNMGPSAISLKNVKQDKVGNGAFINTALNVLSYRSTIVRQ